MSVKRLRFVVEISDDPLEAIFEKSPVNRSTVEIISLACPRNQNISVPTRHCKELSYVLEIFNPIKNVFLSTTRHITR